MSIKRMACVFEQSNHKGAPYYTLLALANFANDDGYVCPCSICDTELRKNCDAYKGDYYEYIVLPEKCEMRLRREKGECDA